MEKFHNSERIPISKIWSFPKPEGRFNDWGERKWLEVSNEKLEQINQLLSQFKAGPRARNLFQTAKLTDSVDPNFIIEVRQRP